jgi:hypothetical protein
MLGDRFAERVVILITGNRRRLRRFEAHVVPAEILKSATNLAETLGPHGGTRSTLTGKETGR